MSRLTPTSVALPLLSLLSLLSPGAALAQGVIETFDAAVTAGDGTTLGAGGELTARLAGGGSVVVGGGQATIAAPTASAAALLASSQPLPDGPFLLRVSLSSIAVPQVPLAENAAVLLGLYDIAPLAQPAVSWVGHGALEITAVSRINPSTNLPETLLAITFWNAGGMGFSYDGAAWVIETGEVYAASLVAGQAYELSLQRTASQYQLQITSGGSTVVSAAMALTQMRPGDLWAMVGFPHTDLGQGQLQLGEVETPLPLVVDGGVGDAGLDGDVTSDGAAGDGGGAADGGVIDAPAADVAPPATDATSPVTDAAAEVAPDAGSAADQGFSADYQLSDGGGSTDAGDGPMDVSGCDCAIGEAPVGTAALPLLLLALALVARRPSRRARR